MIRPEVGKAKPGCFDFFVFCLQDVSLTRKTQFIQEREKRKHCFTFVFFKIFLPLENKTKIIQSVTTRVKENQFLSWIFFLKTTLLGNCDATQGTDQFHFLVRKIVVSHPQTVSEFSVPQQTHKFRSFASTVVFCEVFLTIVFKVERFVGFCARQTLNSRSEF